MAGPRLIERKWPEDFVAGSVRMRCAYQRRGKAALRHEPADDPHVRELTLRSLRKTIKQLKEEIARFEAGVGSSAGDAGRGE